ncbi:Mom family adenine methylcarbamoylation protein [Micromonospora arborensis]|uniref:Mom family adenine methylcarbamoylation protein n=1 Tax=Micromonospora arborensis TaxID=2116518 RepID=UPI0037204883
MLDLTADAAGVDPLFVDVLTLFEAELCQRWSHGQHSWRRTSEGGFDPRRYAVVPLDDGLAREFVTTHHYSRSYPSASLRYGLLEDGQLVGVAVLGVPMSEPVLTKPFPTLVPYRESLELSRLILHDAVPANAESWFLSRVFAAAADHGVRGVVAFSDPLPRMVSGELLMPGHVGTIYQALGAVYTGRATARTLTVLPDGTVLTARSAAKITGAERGMGGQITRLVSLGATSPGEVYGLPLFLLTTDQLTAWLTDALTEVGARKVRHRGNHRFAWAIGNRAQRRHTPIALDALPYPKTPDSYDLAA